MLREAYCDACFMYVAREHAEAHQPCPKCGNTFYYVAGEPLSDGSIPMLSQREENVRKYYNALEEILSIRIKSMTAESYERYINAGERNIAALEAAFDEMVENDRRFGREPELPDAIPMPTKLPDMYMRYGRWEDAHRVYDFCSGIPYLAAMDFGKLKAECDENRRCAAEIETLVSAGTTSQKAIRKVLVSEFPARPVNWVLRYYSRFRRVKAGTDYIVDVVPETELF